MATRRAAVPAAGSSLPWPDAPMLCKSIDALPATGSRAVMSYEPKFDGFRGLVGIDDNGQVQIRSRQNTDLTTAFPDIAAAVADQLPPGTLLDGELVIWNDHQLDFAQLLRRLAGPARAAALARRIPASYVLFDVLQHEGRLLADQPQRVRRRVLESLLPTLAPPLQIVPSTRDRDIAAHWFADYAAADVGIEGLVLKDPAARYLPGRRAWLKLRSRTSTEAVVGAVTGTRASPERLILGRPTPDGTLVVTGSTTPLSPAQRLTVAAYLQPMNRTHPWPADLPALNSGAPRRDRLTRVRPTLVVEIDADTSTMNGRYRHLTRLIRIRPDLRAEDLSGSEPARDTASDKI